MKYQPPPWCNWQLAHPCTHSKQTSEFRYLQYTLTENAADLLETDAATTHAAPLAPAVKTIAFEIPVMYGANTYGAWVRG